MIKIAIFASGSGSNAENIFNYFNEHNTSIRVELILSNSVKAGVHKRAERLGIKSITFDRDQFYHGDFVLDTLKGHQIDAVILAGFLWLVPKRLIGAFPDKIINIHPALLPKYGGKGMYGDHVHKAVIENKEQESGITIHLVNEKYDDGQVLFQASCPVNNNDTYESLAQKIHQLEYEHFPKVIEQYL